MEMLHSSDPYNPDVERCDDYNETFDYYCMAHGIAEERKKALFLMTLVHQSMMCLGSFLS